MSGVGYSFALTVGLYVLLTVTPAMLSFVIAWYEDQCSAVHEVTSLM